MVTVSRTRARELQRARLGLRKKRCYFCVEKITQIDYKDTPRLRKCTTDRGKVVPRRTSGVCAKHQRQLMRAIKRARFMALIPFVAE